MATSTGSSKKRRATENMDVVRNKTCYDESDSDEDNSDIDSNKEIDEEIQVEFEALPPQDDDFHGIKRLLHQLFLKSPVNLSELTHLILAQCHVGSVLKQSLDQIAEETDESDSDDDENIYGIATVLNISDKNAKSLGDVCSLLREKCVKCGTVSDHKQFAHIIDNSSHNVGLMLNERFINIPPQLAPPLHKSLQKDLELASRKNPKFKFDYFLLICKSYRELDSGHKSKKKMAANTSTDELTFTNAEDEYFHKASLLSFSYPVSDESDTAIGGSWSFDDAELQPFRTVMIIPAGSMSDVISQIVENLSV